MFGALLLCRQPLGNGAVGLGHKDELRAVVHEHDRHAAELLGDHRLRDALAIDAVPRRGLLDGQQAERRGC